MGMAFMCEGCKTVYLEGDTIVPQCERCSPEESDSDGLGAARGVFNGLLISTGLGVMIYYGLLWMFQ